jgi:type II secretory pathway pseudopilin PulG
MPRRFKQHAFSIAEVLIAVGILGVAFIFIAGVFPLGIRFTEVSTNRTVGTLVANEAFAKIRLVADEIGPDLSLLEEDEHRDFNDWCGDMDIFDDYYLDPNLYCYPTDNFVDYTDKNYCWSALLRRVDEYKSDPNNPDSSRDVQVTVFVYRRTGENLRYYKPDYDDTKFPGDNAYGLITDEIIDVPAPVRIEIDTVIDRENELRIVRTEDENLINDGDMILDDATGRIYRVIERYTFADDEFILLDKDFVEDDWQGYPVFVSKRKRFVWVVPGPRSTTSRTGRFRVQGKNPCIGIYQRVIRF